MRIRLIIFVCAILNGMFLHAEMPSRVYFKEFSSKSDTCIAIDVSNPDVLSRTIEAHARLTKVKQRDGSARENIYFEWTTPGNTKFRASMHPGNSMFGMDNLSQYMELRLEQFTDNKWHTVVSEKCTKDIGFDTAGNSFFVTFRDSTLIIGAGRNIPQPVITLKGALYSAADTVTFGNNGPICVEGLVYEYVNDPARKLMTDWDESIIKQRMNMTPRGLEGYWEYLDRQNDTRYTRLGGTYRVALVSDGNDGYLILYVSGARVNSHKWKPGMIKGRLKPTIFDNNYNLEWYDSTMTLQNNETFASSEQNAILSLNFPLLKTVIRLARVPKDK